MFYIDNYNSKAISNTPPNKEDMKKIVQTKNELTKQQLAVFWNIVGVAIGYNYEDVKELLAKYGYKVVNEQDAAVAIADLWGTTKWVDFVKELNYILEDTIDEHMTEAQEESGFVAALIGAIGAVAGGTLGLASSDKQKKAAKEGAKTQMLAGLTNVLAAREQRKAAELEAKTSKGKTIVWIIVSLIIVIGLIIGIVIYKKNKKTE
jgi:hypothetical protein